MQHPLPFFPASPSEQTIPLHANSDKDRDRKGEKYVFRCGLKRDGQFMRWSCTEEFAQIVARYCENGQRNLDRQAESVKRTIVRILVPCGCIMFYACSVYSLFYLGKMINVY